MGRRDRRVLLFAVLVGVPVAACADVVTGSCAGLLHLLPFALVLLPLLAGRYIGEERLARLAGALVARPRRRTTRVRPSPRPGLALPRGGRLIASFLAVRPPPRVRPLGA